jgi:uncharacterized membrane protein YcaP (DUF421 family)
MDAFFSNMFFANQENITWWSMCLRTIIIFIASIILIRVGGKRIFGKLGAFDIVVSVMIGTILAKAITGNSKFLPTIFSCLVLVFLHRLFAVLAYRHSAWSLFIKGQSEKLVENGEFLPERMKIHNISEEDIHEAMRTHARVNDIKKVREAYLERSGKISIIPFES